MTTLFVRHQVKDFTAWRQAYLDAAPLQQRSGVLAESVYQAEDDPNDVTVTHEFTSLAEAKALVGTAELRLSEGFPGCAGCSTRVETPSNVQISRRAAESPDRT